ncbi:unnamed protein product [Enterobius vermicularis]|uniref:Ribosome-binding factor A n=1 Tax=Enterobius vermicularis TaxID=51028 RepID=A0A0N4VEQ1_ENTVE|nr:unnamed protein product [Enterobius vermicularis]
MCLYRRHAAEKIEQRLTTGILRVKCHPLLTFGLEIEVVERRKRQDFVAEGTYDLLRK